MEFNKGKFEVMRYGENQALKCETEYFSGDYEEIIERKESLRDLGVQLTDDGCHLPLQEVDIFDNKLELSEIKIAIGQGFR